MCTICSNCSEVRFKYLITSIWYWMSFHKNKHRHVKKQFLLCCSVHQLLGLYEPEPYQDWEIRKCNHHLHLTNLIPIQKSRHPCPNSTWPSLKQLMITGHNFPLESQRFMDNLLSRSYAFAKIFWILCYTKSLTWYRLVQTISRTRTKLLILETSKKEEPKCPLIVS